MKEEIWKPIKNYEKKYAISSYGRVKSLGNNKRKKEKILKPINKKGYLCVDLCSCGKKQQNKIHRLVAQAFIPNPENKPEVNHIDANKINNSVYNLEWCTRSENEIHSYKKGIKKNKLKKINQYNLDGKYIKTWKSFAEITRTLGIRDSNLWCCCNNITKTAGGYKWKYAKTNK